MPHAQRAVTFATAGENLSLAAELQEHVVARILASIIGWGGEVAVRRLATARVRGRPFLFALQVNGALRGWDLTDPYKPHRAISQRLPVPPSVRCTARRSPPPALSRSACAPPTLSAERWFPRKSEAS